MICAWRVLKLKAKNFMINAIIEIAATFLFLIHCLYGLMPQSSLPLT